MYPSCFHRLPLRLGTLVVVSLSVSVRVRVMVRVRVRVRVIPTATTRWYGGQGQG